ncbi:MAG: hypothetical protein Q6362_003510 [Candidatus Wukongarchaeota archaeon]|nr:hypothetical protein [Candidatus Wukongarchaeota archaeon]MDO8128499.1 hypothetical protein [Candidatus Wukongarchaeota archaeon]
MPEICHICGAKTEERECDICGKPVCRECAKFMVTYVEDYLRRRQRTLRVCPKCKISFRKPDELVEKIKKTG